MRGVATLASVLLVATAACTYDPRGVDVPEVADAAPADAAPDAEPADADLPDASPPDARACPPEYQFVAVTGSAYRLRNFGRDFEDAVADCENEGAGIHLVVIDDPIEMQFVDSLAPQTDVWVGIDDLVTEGTFLTVTGAPPAFLPWSMGEPNDFGLNEDCVELVGNTLNDAVCTRTLPSVCECGP